MKSKFDDYQLNISAVYDIFQKYNTVMLPYRTTYARLKRFDRSFSGCADLRLGYVQNMTDENYECWKQYIVHAMAHLLNAYERDIVLQTHDDTFHIEFVIQELKVVTDFKEIFIKIALYYKKLDKPTL